MKKEQISFNEATQNMKKECRKLAENMKKISKENEKIVIYIKNKYNVK